jgi:hypothetical protein
MLETLSSLSLLAAMEIIGAAALLIALIYGTVRWSNRSRASKQLSEDATRSLYRKADQQEKPI